MGGTYLSGKGLGFGGDGLGGDGLGGIGFGGGFCFCCSLILLAHGKMLLVAPDLLRYSTNSVNPYRFFLLVLDS